MTKMTEDLTLNTIDLDEVAVAAMRKMNDRYLHVLRALPLTEPTEAENEDDRAALLAHSKKAHHDRVFRATMMCNEIASAQEVFASLCQGKSKSPWPATPTLQLTAIEKALAHPAVEAHDICPSYKGSKVEMHHQAVLAAKKLSQSKMSF